MTKISKVIAREVLDSRGNPTVECELTNDGGQTTRAIVPSGASTGIHEALELRDKDPNRYHGKGVQKAIANIHEEIAPQLTDKEINTQEALDQMLLELDGTQNKSSLGANAILAVSMAFARMQAMEQGKKLYETLTQSTNYSLPRPMCNVINGGEHADNSISFQEFMIVPMTDTSFAEKIRMSSEVFHCLKKLLKAAGKSTGVGDEGGFAPDLDSAEEALEYIIKAMKQANYEPGADFTIALDVAASEFYEDGMYQVNKNGSTQAMTSAELLEYYQELAQQFPIISIEDPFAEDDWNAWAQMTSQYSGSRMQIVGDDLLVTNVERLQKAIDQKACNAILIKLNQIGTVTETLKAIKIAQENGFGVVISHRSGETEDAFIADLAVATNAGQIKTGSLSRTDRTAKYNQLIRIEGGLN